VPTLDVQHTEHPATDENRNGQLGDHSCHPRCWDVPRITGHVVHKARSGAT
jgi:hypothetical protein